MKVLVCEYQGQISQTDQLASAAQRCHRLTQRRKEIASP
jgi:hypothetical protein